MVVGLCGHQWYSRFVSLSCRAPQSCVEGSSKGGFVPWWSNPLFIILIYMVTTWPQMPHVWICT